MTINNLKTASINNLTIPDTEDTKELADMAVEQFARFFWEYWVWMKGLEKKANKDSQ